MKRGIQITCLAVLSTIFWLDNSLEAQNILPSKASQTKEKWKMDLNNTRSPEKIAEDVAEASESLREENREIALGQDANLVFPPIQSSEESQSPIVIKNTKAIVLVGKESELHRSEYRDLNGIYVYSVNFPGNQKDLKKKLSKYLGKTLSLYDITAIKKNIIEYYKSQGRPVVVVQVPEQDITEGVVQILITEALLGDVESKGNKHFKSSRLEQYVKLKPDQPINETELVKNLNFMNRNPFRRTDAVYTPGEKTGTTDIELITKDRRPIRIYAGVDNTGLERTGETRWYAGFNWGNAFGLDQQLSYQYTTSSDFHKFQAHTVNYGIPLPWQHMVTVYGGYSSIHAELPGMHGGGHAYQASLRYDIPLIPIRRYIHEFTLGGDFKRTNNTIEDQEQRPEVGPNVNLTQLAFGYNGGLELERSKTFVEAELFYSPGSWVADQSEEAYSKLRPGAKPDYAYFLGSLVYIQYLPENISLSALFRGQVATTNLLPSEQFGLGGYNSVRGYEERQVNTDNAILLSGEVRSPSIGIARYFGNHKIKDGLQFLAFLDYGLGKDYKSLPDTPSYQWLMGVGPGLRYSIDPYLSIRLDYGFKLHREDFDGGIGRVHFAVIASY